ncbi:MAG: sensor domain-containing diguanylate cyclase [Nitrospirota bacterium]|nr:sensor domain-containing diguanylate cyclase [Nitrospirota bacterium]
MIKKEVAVLVQNDVLLKFLQNFFNNVHIYNPRYYKSAQSFIRRITERRPLAVIVEEPFLEVVSDRITRFPSIAIVTGNIKKGVENAVVHHVSRYIYKPYLERDLEYKLESIILGKDLIEKMKNEMQELEVITCVTQLISDSLDPKEILFKIVEQIAKIMHVTRCSIVRVDWIHRNAFVVATFEDPNLTGIRLNLKKYPEITEALISKKPVIVDDITTDPIMRKVRDILMQLGIRSILVIPIIFREKVIGTLLLRTSRKGQTFTGNEIKLLNAIANASANALYNAFLFEQAEDEKTRLEKLAITDYLTGIYNIRYFYHRIIEEFSRCQRYSQPIGCLMVDIDHFKKINDAYGHKTGDRVLKEFAQLLRKHSRKSDVLARYGGEEFIFLLPQTPLKGVLLEAERIRKSIKDHKFKSMKYKRGLTVSIGISVYPHKKITTHDDLITYADDALFTAKESGRDRVVVYSK